MFGLYSLKALKKKHNISIRYARHLILNKHLEAVVKNGQVFVTEESLKKFLAKSKKERKEHQKSFVQKIGPGIITGAADDDPSGIGTYSTVGSRFGLGLSWMALYLLPMMTAVQETCARIGIVTGKGLAGSLKKKFGNPTVFILVFLLIVANTINIGADIGAVAASIRMITGINFYLAAILFTSIIILLEVFVKYHQYAKILRWLVLSLAAYLITGIIIQPDWGEVLRSLAVPKIEFNTEYILAIVAVLGTTISPYLFFWQSSQEVEEKKDDGTLSDHRSAIINEEIHEMRKDVVSGMSIANLVFLFIVITTAFVLFKNGITNIETAEQAASALEPFAGQFAAHIFTLGIIGTGILAIPVLAGASAYAISEVLKWREGLSLKFGRAHGFYGIIILSTFVGLLMNLIGINPITALYYAAVINGLVASVLLVFIFKIGSDKEIMGAHISPGWVKAFGTLAVVFMGISSLLLIITFILGIK
ncbi:divalent metal cation transporter [candidate division WS5 bacterium]|uniref:Divalent metal cation transporter n=1 Tax=candidate division WS5 bacterium TaxID=2093353 RepID=A0A419DFP0_9BACT|nr:MAG: divalent metal cation transporter [candidate division WS5 bacterium]